LKNDLNKSVLRLVMALFQELLDLHNTGILNAVNSVLVQCKLD